MSKRDITAGLKDIREAIERIQRYVGTLSLDDFLTNTEKQDAVVRNFEIIGEAAKGLPSEFRKKHKHVEWGEMAGFRDKLWPWPPKRRSREGGSSGWIRIPC